MKRLILSSTLALLLGASLNVSHAAGFTYQGTLQDAGKPADGTYDLELTLYSAADHGTVIGGPLTMLKVPVQRGAFSTKVDFGPLTKTFSQAWLGIKVRNGDSGDFSAMSERLPVNIDVVDTATAACPGSWALSGNAGNPTSAYLGTSDNVPLNLNVYGERSFQITEMGDINNYHCVNIIGGVHTNSITGICGTIAGGGSIDSSDYSNKVTSNYGSILGGEANSAAGYASELGGQYNVASRYGSTVLGGFQNQAGGDDSLAAGIFAHVRNASEAGNSGGDAGTFIWSDAIATSVAPFVSTGTNQFLVHAAGGVGINTANGALGTEALGGAELTVRSSSGDNHETWIDLLSQANASDLYRGFNFAAGPGGTFHLRSLYNASGTVSYDPILSVTSAHVSGGSNAYIAFNRSSGASPSTAIFQVGTTTSNGNGAYLTAGGVWTNGSSRMFKESFEHIDALDVLARVVSLPVQTWFYKYDHSEGRHMGPIAEDFAASFGLGNDDTHIGTVDESGVAFAAIQGLNQKLEAEKAANELLQSKLDATTASLAKLSERLSKLEHTSGE